MKRPTLTTVHAVDQLISARLHVICRGRAYQMISLLLAGNGLSALTISTP